MKSIKLLLIILPGFYGIQLNAQKSTFCSFAIFYDQDYILEKTGLKSLNRDCDYTMGIGISLTLPGIKHNFLMAPHYALNGALGKKRFNDRTNSHPEIVNSIMLSNGTFTPEDLYISYPIRNDRPYGSLTYLQTSIMATDQNHFRHYTTTFSAGIIGLFLSREVQTAIHKSMNDGDTHTPRTPKGWSNQISNGGEPTLGYTYEEQRLLVGRESAKAAKSTRFGLELKQGWKYSLGYYTMANYSLNWRIGKITPGNWTYTVNPLGGSDNVSARTTSIEPVFASNEEKETIVAKKTKCEFYTFGSLRTTFMLYNALLNGQFKKSANTLNFQDIRHLIFEFDGGIALSVPFSGRKVLEIKTMISGRTPEFKLRGRAPRWLYWGGLHFIISHAS